MCLCFLASHEGSQRRKEISLYTLWLQMQVGSTAEVPRDQAHRYHSDLKLDIIILTFLRKTKQKKHLNS